MFSVGPVAILPHLKKTFPASQWRHFDYLHGERGKKGRGKTLCRIVGLCGGIVWSVMQEASYYADITRGGTNHHVTSHLYLQWEKKPNIYFIKTTNIFLLNHDPCYEQARININVQYWTQDVLTVFIKLKIKNNKYCKKNLYVINLSPT